MEDKDVCEFIEKMMKGLDSTEVPELVDVKGIMEEAKKIKFTIPEGGFILNLKKEK